MTVLEQEARSKHIKEEKPQQDPKFIDMYAGGS